MNKDFNFKEWISKTPEDIYGFPSLLPEKKERTPLYELEPLEPIKVSQILKELVNLGKIGTREPNTLFENKIAFGTNDVGRLIVEVSPYGSLKIIIRRTIKNLQGESVGICKKIIPLINDYNHISETDKTEEYHLAYDLNRYLNKIDKESLEKPSNQYEGLRNLTIKMAQNMRIKHPSVMIYNGVMQNNENYYTIYFSYTGEGVEAPGSNRVEQFNVNISYESDLGLIRCWGNEIVSPIKRRSWKLQPSEWDEYFTPSQKDEEIVYAIAEAFSTY
jgi:hypothetical protein